MTTVAAEHTRSVFPLVKPHRPSAVLSGIVPDGAHLDDGGYHVSIDDLVRYGNAGDYSNTRKLDKAPPVTATGRRNSCAVDISMSPADMKATYTAVETVWKNRDTDTRAKYINAINVWSGKSGVAPVRFNFQQGTRNAASKDHEWHVHGDWVRVFVDQGYSLPAAQRAARAMASTLIGQSHDAWQRQEKIGPYAVTAVKPTPAPAPAPTPAPTDDDDEDTMNTQTYAIPAGYGYSPDGKPIPGNESNLLAVGTPPAGHKDHRWGKDHKLFLSLAADHLTREQNVRIALNDGKTWHVQVITLKPGQTGRTPVPVPAIATQAGWNISAGRIAPEPTDGNTPAATGVIGLVVELLHN